MDLAFNLSRPLDLGARIGDDRPRSSPMSRQVSVFPDHRPLHVPAVGESATCSRGNHKFLNNLFNFQFDSKFNRPAFHVSLHSAVPNTLNGADLNKRGILSKTAIFSMTLINLLVSSMSFGFCFSEFSSEQHSIQHFSN